MTRKYECILSLNKEHQNKRLVYTTILVLSYCILFGRELTHLLVIWVPDDGYGPRQCNGWGDGAVLYGTLNSMLGTERTAYFFNPSK